MLMLTRRTGESIIIRDEITITVLSINENQARIGVEAPKGMKIYYEELGNEILEKPEIKEKMLMLNRRPGGSLIIKENIKVTILAIKKNQIRIGVEAPRDLEIYREELGVQKFVKSTTKKE